MKSKLITSFLLTIILTLTLVSAADLTVTGSLAINANHGTTATGSLVVTDSSALNFTTVSLGGNNITFSPSTFSSLNVGATRTIAYSVSIPLYTPAGTYAYSFTINGTKSDGAFVTYSNIIYITVASSPSLSLTAPVSLTKTSNKTSITLANNGNTALSGLTISYSPAINDSRRTATIAFSPSTISLLNAGESQIINITASVPDNFNLGDYTTTITAGNSQTSATTTLTLSQGFCLKGNVGSGLDIRNVDDKQLDNTDEWEWYPEQNIEIDVRVRNNAGEDLDGVLEYGLYDPANNDFVDLDEDTIDFSIDDGKSEDITIKLKIPSDIDSEVASKNFRLYIKVYEDGDEDTRCADIQDNSLYQTVEVKKNKRDLTISDVTFPTSALCGDSLSFRSVLYNIGRSDEDKVKVVAYNRDLGINATKEFSNFDIGDSASLNFDFTVPGNITEKQYTLNFRTYYDYDSDDETYSASETKDFILSVSGGCQSSSTSSATILPVLVSAESEIKAGNEIIIKATIKNTGASRTNYLVSVQGNEAFSSVQSINPSLLTLDGGVSGDSLVTLKLNSDAAGEQQFNIKLSFNGKEISQPVSISVADSGFSFGNFGDTIKNNWIVVFIVLINIILIVAIIIVIVRMARE
ncbi:putative S-layer protein [Candidatus Pacearchaeota archaeon]|nr:putative S-layer protein [Candidatus Pacearchaeota archaeon]